MDEGCWRTYALLRGLQSRPELANVINLLRSDRTIRGGAVSDKSSEFDLDEVKSESRAHRTIGGSFESVKTVILN